jgi:hypothetical protein
MPDSTKTTAGAEHPTELRTKLTVAQLEMLANIGETGMPERGESWASHSQRRLDSLVGRGLVSFAGAGWWRLTDAGRSILTTHGRLP